MTFALDTGAFGYYNEKRVDSSIENLEAFGETDTPTLFFTLGGREFSTVVKYLETPYRDMLPFDFLLRGLFFDHDVFIDFDGAMVYMGK